MSDVVHAGPPRYGIRVFKQLFLGQLRAKSSQSPAVLNGNYHIGTLVTGTGALLAPKWRLLTLAPFCVKTLVLV